MITSVYTTGIESRMVHENYVEESHRYRMIAQARRNQAAHDHPRARRATIGAGLPRGEAYLPLERIGAALIGFGRRLCEHRGAVAVEVAFRAGHGSTHRGPKSQHVA